MNKLIKKWLINNSNQLEASYNINDLKKIEEEALKELGYEKKGNIYFLKCIYKLRNFLKNNEL